MMDRIATNLAAMPPHFRKHHLLTLVDVLGGQQQWDTVAVFLTSLPWLEATAGLGLVFDLADDCDRVASALRDDHPDREIMHVLTQAVRQDAHFIARHPDLLFQCLWNTLRWLGESCDNRDTGAFAAETSSQLSGHGRKRMGVLLQSWMEWKSRQTLQRPWLASLRPPMRPIGPSASLHLRGHTKQVLAVASLKAESIVSVADDGTCRTWCASTGAEQSRLSVDRPDGRIACLSPNGLMSCSNDPWKTQLTVKVVAGEPDAFALEGHRGQVLGSVFSQDSRVLITWSTDRTIRGWTLGTRCELFRVRRAWRDRRDIHSMAFCEENGLLAYSSGLEIRVVAFETNNTVATFSDLFSLCKQIVFLRDQLAILVITCTGGAFLWLYRDGQNAITWLHRDKAYGRYDLLRVKPKRTGLVVAYMMEDTPEQEPEQVLPADSPPSDDVTCAALSHDGRMIAVGTEAGGIRLFDTDGCEKIKAFSGHISSVTCIAFGETDTRVISGAMDGAIIVCNVQAEEWGSAAMRESSMVHSLAFAQAGKSVVTGHSDGRVCLWDIASGKQTAQLLDSMSRTRALLCPRHADTVVCSSWDGVVRVWSIALETEMLAVSAMPDVIAISEDGRTLCVSDDRGAIRAWNTDSGRLAMKRKCWLRRIVSLGCSPDGRYMAAGDSKGGMRIWDVLSGRKVAQLKGHTHAVSSIAFSPDSTHLVSGSWDRSVRVWRREDGSQRAVLDERQGVVSQVMFCSLSDHVVFRYDMTVREWDWRKGEIVSTYPGCVDMAAVADGHSFVPAIIGPDMAVVSRQDKHLVAKWPYRHSKYVSHPSQPLWIGASGGHIEIMTLQGAPPNLAV